jgi:hypothetical protein
MARAEIRAPFWMVALSICSAAFDGCLTSIPLSSANAAMITRSVVRSRCPTGRSTLGPDRRASRS